MKGVEKVNNEYEETQKEIDDLKGRLKKLDIKTAIHQFSHGQTSEAIDTIYFK